MEAPAVVGIIRDVLPAPDRFSDPRHQVIYAALIELAERGDPTDAQALKDHLEQTGNLAQAGGALYLVEVYRAGQYATDPTYQARMIAREANLRRITAALDRGQAWVQNPAHHDDLPALLAAIRDEAAQALADVTAGQAVAAQAASALPIRSLADIAAEVDARPPRPFLFQPVWAAGDYGVMSAQDKAGKTWAILDAAVSAAAGLPWLGEFPCQTSGGVLAFLGEGSDAKMLRRIRAIGAHKGLTREEIDALPIRLCLRAPRLSRDDHLAVIAADLERHRPVLAIVDPLYLAAGGANGADLYSMGELLGGIQHVAQATGTSLLISHHWNKTGEGRGHNRSSGVGPGAWGRVLISVAVLNSRTDPATKETVVRLQWSFKGDEIPEDDYTFVRRVWADKPEDLNSALNYEIKRADDTVTGDTTEEAVPLRPAARRVLTVLQNSASPLTVSQIGDLLAKEGNGNPPLKKRTIQDALKALEAAELAHEAGARAGAPVWIADAAQEEPT
ncbi:AAA family ATPase [Microbispora sp. SCL1-1]|nr:AAA family ATPase [Microbispora sp. CL1-1]TQS09434.1 AAA family ATPase [Microbispora sp. SCL1-1]